MLSSWLGSTWGAVGLVVLSAALVYVALIVFTRVAGLRSFSKMSSFDFAVTVAIGSLIASTIVAADPPLLQGIVALGALYAIQLTVAAARRSRAVSALVDNEPLLLMAGREILDDNLRKAKITRADLLGKLREANVLDFGEVRAVVMESTGDVSVLHASDENVSLHPDLLEGVRDADRLRH